ncbi:hypothetical protein PG995_002265 [Apiospora arundinis]
MILRKVKQEPEVPGEVISPHDGCLSLGGASSQLCHVCGGAADRSSKLRSYQSNQYQEPTPVSHWWFIVFVLRDCHEKSRLDIVFLKKLKSKGNLTMYIHAVNMHLRLVHNFFQNRI